ncbi:MarR family winged helix-turn-helix transcriptional regulator [Leifsonia sp. A12D58]|uniref:MarR family winged helix-turn-helix transcriptional regulator n=1 Tax=Leifsonia sp. A12D58 TaxID=3397674 RepID=UPI0039E0F12E
MADRAVVVAAWESLFRAQVAIMRSLAADFPSKEISLNEYDVMFNLSRQPGWRIRLRDLNKHVLLSQPSVSRLVDRLVSRGYLEKEIDPADGRGAIIGLTQSGYDLFRRVARDHMVTITNHMSGSLDEAELKQLTALCDRLREGAES